MALDRRNLPAVREGELATSATIPHLDISAVRRLIDAARTAPQTGERNALLIAVLFDGCLRVSEALGLRPVDLVQSDMGWVARVMGTGRKAGLVALSSPLVGQLHAYAYRRWGCPGTAASSRLAGAGYTRSFRKPPIPPVFPSRSMWARSTS